MKSSLNVLYQMRVKKEHPLGYSSAHDWLLIFGGYVATDLATFDTE